LQFQTLPGVGHCCTFFISSFSEVLQEISLHWGRENRDEVVRWLVFVCSSPRSYAWRGHCVKIELCGCFPTLGFCFCHSPSPICV
jgi:hypothetical protein